MRTMPEFSLKRFFNQAAAATARANLSPSFAEPLGTADLLALEPDAERLRALLHRSPRDFGHKTSLWTLALAAEEVHKQGLTTRNVRKVHPQ